MGCQCIDTFCPSNLQQSKDVSGGTAAKAGGVKTSKYSHLDRVYIFQPIAFETCGSTGPSSESFLHERLGKEAEDGNWRAKVIYLLTSAALSCHPGWECRYKV